MNLSSVIIQNHRKDYDEIVKSIETHLSTPGKDSNLTQTATEKFHGFSFALKKSHRMILPVIKEHFVKKGFKDLKWDYSEKWQTTYVYLHI